VKAVEKHSLASDYFTRDVTWTLRNACDPTFYWPVRCAPCTGHTRQKNYPFKIDCKIIYEGCCFHV